MKKLGIILFFGLFVSAAVFLFSCKKKEQRDSLPTPISLEVPLGWPAPNNILFANNQPTEEGFQLGRKLFYDGKLSRDGNFPCASCHQQFAGFATFDHDLSHGIDNSFTTRNAQPIFNLAWKQLYHWDGAINHLDLQPLAPITAANEMGESISNVLKKLQEDPQYPKMFKAAFGTEEISSQKMLLALSQFMGTIVSNNSKYDQVQKGTATYTTEEALGYNLFKSKCNSCHQEPLFTDNTFRNNGLSINIFLKDGGRKKVTGLASDSLKFAVPTLRNAELTYPYFHDGRYASLGEVLNHYSFEIETTQPTLDPLLRNRIFLTNAEKSQLIAFIKTLTDRTLVSNPRFSQP